MIYSEGAYQRNQFAFDWLGVSNYHKAGNKGRGLRVLVFDDNFIISKTSMKNVISGGSSSGDREHIRDGRRSDHGLYSCSILNQLLPEAEIHFLSCNVMGPYSMMQYAIEKGIDIVSVSLSYPYPPNIRELSERAAAAGIVLITSAGNSGAEGITFPASKASWIAVGAAFVHQMFGTIHRATYSSTGKELEVMGYTGRWVESYGGGITQYTGTSCACPMVAGMVGLYMDRNGKTDSNGVREMFLRYCVDMHDPGWDHQTGYGMLRLPPIEGVKPMKEIVLKIDSATVTVNGQPVRIDAPATIMNNRAMVPLSFIARQLGAEVTWDAIKREVTIRG